MVLCTRRGRTVCLILIPSARTVYWFYAVPSFSRKTDPPQSQSSCCLNMHEGGKKPSVTATLPLLDSKYLDTGLQRKSYPSSFQEFCEQHLQRASSQKTTPFCGGPHPTPAGSRRIQSVQPSVGGMEPYLLRPPQWVAQGILLGQLSLLLPDSASSSPFHRH